MTYLDPQLSQLTYVPERPRPERLIESHMPLVRKIAWHVHGSGSAGIEVEDLLQIGMVALVEAAHSYEERGLGFTNYAKLRVRGAMIDHLRKTSSISRTAMTFRKTLAAARKELELELGRSPDSAELAVAMNMSNEAFNTAIENSTNAELASIDELYSDQNAYFADPAATADVVLEGAQQAAALAGAIANLPEREALILQLYFVEEMNLDEIGATLDIGAARVCQIKKAALEKVKAMLEES
ncbi:MAG: FliA/WhiG family RNA polymerase sigma factor [Parasphingorhabdus sp.]|nr:FliA/WhiG family RNA polymerase sigma factor [Parasphingorhabdus sp.]